MPEIIANLKRNCMHPKVSRLWNVHIVTAESLHVTNGREWVVGKGLERACKASFILHVG